MSKTTNPIIAAIIARSSEKKNPRGFTLIGCDTFSPSTRSVVRRKFDAETLRELGVIVLCALVNNDDRIIKIVSDALRAADGMFHRNHEPKLLGQVLGMMSEGCAVEFDQAGRAYYDIEKLKREVERRFYKGKPPLEQYHWTRVGNALNWPKSPTGAAAARYKRDTKRRSKLY